MELTSLYSPRGRWFNREKASDCDMKNYVFHSPIVLVYKLRKIAPHCICNSVQTVVCVPTEEVWEENGTLGEFQIACVAALKTAEWQETSCRERSLEGNEKLYHLGFRMQSWILILEDFYQGSDLTRVVFYKDHYFKELPSKHCFHCNVMNSFWLYSHV